MSIQSLVDSLDASFGTKASDARRRAAMDMIAAEEQRRLLKADDRAPLFSLPHSDRGPVSSVELLRQGPLVVCFYRGLWCPYCQRDLLGLEEAMAQFRLVNATVLAISHRISGEGSREFHDGQKFSFPVLDDLTGAVAEQFGIRWSNEELSLIEEELGWDLSVMRGTQSWIRPMQARYVISKAGVIVSAEVAFDYDQRTEPSEVLPTLAALAR